MEFEHDLTTEKIRKKFSSQFSLVEYMIQQAKGMILTGRRSHVRIAPDNFAAHVIEGSSNGRGVTLTKKGAYINQKFCTFIIAFQQFKYEKQLAAYTENVQFVDSLRADPLFQPVYSFAMQELDELPRREAKAFEQAINRIDAGQGTKEDRELMKTKYDEFKAKFINLTSSPIPAVPNNTAPVAAATQDKIAQAASHPRTGMLGGSSSGKMMTEAEIERLLDEGAIDKIPKNVLEKLMRGE